MNKNHTFFLAVCAFVLLSVFCPLMRCAEAAPEPVLYIQGIPKTIHPSEMNTPVTARIMLGGVSNFSAVSFILEYDSNFIEIEDSDGERFGVNISASESFDAVYVNEVESMKEGLSRIRFFGVIHKDSLSMDPITIAELRFHIKKQGHTFLMFKDSEFLPEKTEVICCSTPEAAVVKPRSSHAHMFIGEKDVSSPGVTVSAPRPEHINPAGEQEFRSTELTYTLDEDAKVHIWVVNGAGQTVRDFGIILASNVVQNGLFRVTWNGLDNYSRVVPDGSYSFRIQAMDGAQNQGETVASKQVVVDTQAPRIMVLESNNPAFSPNGDGNKDFYSLKFSVDEESNVSVTVFPEGADPQNQIPIETLISKMWAGTNANDVVWYGTTAVGDPANDTRYSICIEAVDNVGNRAWRTIEPVVVDLAPPALSDPMFEKRQDNGRFVLSAHVFDPGEGTGIDASQGKAILDGKTPLGFVDNSAGRIITEATPIAVGPHIAKATVFDVAGNSSSIEWEFTIGEDPDIQLTSVVPIVFNPAHARNIRFLFTTDKSGEFSGKIFNDSQVVSWIENIWIGGGESKTLTWDGAWDAVDNTVRNGQYYYKFHHTSMNSLQRDL